jgi:penicillin-binding protein 1A
MGISSKLEANASIALGTSEVSMMELVGAYAPFANGGYAATPYVVTRIRTVEGKKVLYARRNDAPSAVIDARAVAAMNTMMQQTILSGSAKKAELPGWFAAGKTGTSQDFRDAWFIGYTSQLVTGVWLGNDDNSPTRKATGGGLPVDIWSRFMKVAHQGLQPEPVPGLAPSSAFSTNPIGQALSSLLPGTNSVAPQQQQQPPQRELPPERGYVPSAPVYNGYRAQPNDAPTQANYPAQQRQRPQQQNVRPEAASGIDGWLSERLFGR